MTLAVEIYRSVPRYLAARAVADRAPGLLAGPVAPVRLVNRKAPSLPGEGWVRVRTHLSGICGSDLATISGTNSFYFSALVSLPFVPGHEVVGEVVGESGDAGDGRRVVIDPTLHCEARGVEPPCGPCERVDTGLCERVTAGHVGPGLQTGYCDDVGGGWGGSFVAHRSQLIDVPEELTDEAAVMIEPAACAIHAVRRAEIPDGAHVLVVGAGTVGLLTTLAVNGFSDAGKITVVAKHPHQAEIARRFGAAEVVAPDEALGLVRRATRAFRLEPERSEPFLLGGVDVAFECVGSSSALNLALRTVKGRGKVILGGIPTSADLTPAWFRELSVIGAYSGAGAFDDAVRLASEAELGKLVSAAYPLGAWREAIDHALAAGRLGATKIVFDPRLDRDILEGDR